jgi:DNA invertase Pin-like site-specific DNA recombinase
MYNNILQAPNFYKVGLYIRLSEADENKNYETESESVINQRNLLMDYIKQNGFVFIDEYVDDGFTGTNFDRPAFKKMLEDIEEGRINTVITKDLSRLGRDYIQCGYYVEEYFPSKKIRFISILDQVDTFLETANNDIAPFKALFNDMSSKETSKKIRLILKNKKEQGKFIGSAPCYGYMRDPLDKGKLIPNPDYAPIVKTIFKMADSGVGMSNITTYLNNRGFETPSIIKMKNPNRKGYNHIWTRASVNKILKNKMYIGDMVQNVQTKLSYKSQKKISLDKSYWIIVENTHEPLVDREVFERIQNSPARTRITYKSREKRLFENLLYCKECGCALSIANRRHLNYWSINCNKYSRDPKRRLCEPHFAEYNNLEIVLLEKIKSTCKKSLEKINISNLAETLANLNMNQEDSTNKQNELNLKKIELQRKQDMLYEDKFNGIVSVDSYLRLSGKIEQDLKRINNQLTELDNTKITIDMKQEIIKYQSIIKEMIDIEKPSRELMKTIIDKIYIDNDKNIEIIYKFNFV